LHHVGCGLLVEESVRNGENRILVPFISLGEGGVISRGYASRHLDVARTILDRFSPRRSGHFGSVMCASIPN
jgi:hypothetical protein